MRIFGAHRSRPASDHQKEVERLDRAFSVMIRERDGDDKCIACGRDHSNWDAGHYRRRELMPTRFHPQNVNKEGVGCNRGTHNNKFGMKDMDFYRENLDRKWGKGTADRLYKLSQKIEPWTTEELEQLRSAARMGYPVYCQFYRKLRPHHWN